MFEHRQSSQKPSSELQRQFKSYIDAAKINPAALSTSSQSNAASLNALDVALNPRQYADQHGIKDSDPTPRASAEQWNFSSTGLTPSVLDPNSSTFNTFANQMPGYYTPTPGGTNTLYHPQAGDLHTPGFGLGLGTPLSMPHSEAALHAHQSFAHTHAFSHAMHHMNQAPYGAMVNPFQMHQSTFPPQNFQHQAPVFEQLDTQETDSPMCGDINLDVEMSNQNADVLFQSHSASDSIMALPQHPSSENFRYRATLNAPTAMVRSTDEIPVTYLNKGQAYTLNVVDTAPQQSMVGQLKYRTFVRVSFEEDSQRQRPGSCWQLWKEGRGTNEAHQRGGRLQAVEYVEQNQSSTDASRPKMELESSSFDGFCVTWSPGANGSGTIECPISVRFNFLSTDFSHSKGVKGIPVRLCAKTELLLDSMSPTQQPTHEVCYCRVKLFRDHGAERKLSNDVAHVKKMIDKLNQQISQIESGMRDSGKRKRSGSISKPSAMPARPGKVPKHRRTWSMSSTASNGRSTAEEDLHMKLIGLQDMFGSTRPISILFLRGAEEDDPDLHPVRLSGESQELSRIDTNDTTMWEGQSNKTNTSSMVSPTPSNQSLASSFRRPSGFGPPSRVSSNEWRRSNSQIAPMDLNSSNPQHLASPPDQPVKIQANSPSNGGAFPGWFEAVGVDASYQPPPERNNKPVACFYMQFQLPGKAPEDGLYRAVYLTQRSLKDFVSAAANKCGIEPSKVVRTVRVNYKGLQILMDDESVRELPEGQDMKAEFSFSEMHPHAHQNDWHSRAHSIDTDSGYELKLLF